MEEKCKITTYSNKKITIKQIANDLGYSPTVVSHSLSHKGTVGEKTRQHIIEYAKKIGYTPSIQAQTVRKKTIKIAVHLPSNPPFLFEKFSSGIKNAVSGFTGNSVSCDFLQATRHSFEQLCSILENIIEGEYDGAIIVLDDELAGRRPDLSEKINGKNIPILTLGHKSSYLKPCASVFIDAKRGGAMAADMLSIAGCKRPLVLFGNTADIHQLYTDGFVNQAKEYGMEVTVSDSTEDDEATVYAKAREYLIGGRYDGVFLTNCFGWAVTKAMDELNLKLPFICMDLFPQTEKLIKENKLTATICQHQVLQGKTAMNYLFNAILSGKGEYEDILIAPEIITKAHLSEYHY